MIENSLYETPYVEQIYTEFLTQINRYQNKNRRSIFCRYYNINANASDYNTETGATFDRYGSGILYDIYDYTPLYTLTPIVNETMNDEETTGQRFVANSDITIYTIKEPHIEDLVVFNNKPLDGSEIFRVSNIRASINSMNSDPNTYWFQNSIEYANVIDLSKIHTLNHYVYSVPMERYLLHDDFTRFVKNVENFNKVLKKFEQNYFDEYQELFFIWINGQKFYPKYENKIIYNFLATKNFLTDQFITIKRPYSVSYISQQEIKCDCISEVYTDYCRCKNYKADISKLNIDYNYDVFDISNMISDWIWYYNYEKYPSECSNSEVPNYILDSNNIFELDGLLYNPGKNSNLIVDVRKLPSNTIEAAYGCI